MGLIISIHSSIGRCGSTSSKNLALEVVLDGSKSNSDIFIQTAFLTMGNMGCWDRHARIDIESMRLCPLPVPEPSGAFGEVF